RITARIDDSVRVALPGSVPHEAAAEFDQGEAPASATLLHVRLTLERSPEQKAALDRQLDELIDPSSPNYHRWLTPDEFGARFGAAEADVEAIRDWLEAEGFTVAAIPRSRMSVEFAGTVDRIEQVFHTSIHAFQRGHEKFLANVGNPSIPVALAPAIAGIVDMNTIPVEHDIVLGPRGVYDPATRRMVPVAGQDRMRPEYTGSFDGAPFLYITPADASTMYNTPNQDLNANFGGGASYDGKGVTIGIIGDAELTSSATTPIANWRKRFLPARYAFPLTITNVDGATSSNGADEAFLDIETAGGIAPGASLHFYTSADSILPAMQQAVDDNTVDILNVSFGMCEFNAGNQMNQTILGDWQQAAAEGITVTVSAGDTGSARCDQNGSNRAAEGLAVNAYGSTPYNIVVGGTDTFGLVNSFSEYVDPESSNSAKSYYRTVLAPIPEATWNDSQDNADAVPGPISKAVVYQNTTGAGGGGSSSCSTQSSAGKCTAGYPKPSWQAAAGVPNDGVRDLPDVSLMSGPGYDNAAWLVCSTDLGSCAVEAGGEISFRGVGGTSAAAPTFAGILALLEQKTGERLGQEAGKNLYAEYNNFGSRVFNDITLGNNAPPCYPPEPDLPSPDCVKNSEGYYLESAYNAGAGYDRATGLGSVNATNLIAFWGAAAPLAATVTVRPAKTSVFRGDALTVTVTVAGKSSTPTGTVKLACGGFVSAAKPLADGKVSFEIPANVLAAGIDTLKAAYSGDAKFGEAAGSAKVTVTLLTPTVTVTPAAKTISRAKTLKVSVKVAASAGTPTGTVTLSSGHYKSAAKVLVSGKATITISADELAAGSDTLTARYSGSADYKTASGHVTVKVTQPADVGAAPVRAAD
ncbi:MAG: protease pro-enzyme activation domain-containing protein, partial [Terracidiphilus sp.]